MPQRRLAVVAAAVLAALLACLAILLYALPRGFDFLDESYYLLAYQHPGDLRLSLTQFHQLVRLMGLGSLSVIGYRVVCVVLCVGSGGALGWATLGAWRGSKPPWREALVAATLGMLGATIYFTWGPRALSYNTLNGALCCLELVGALVLARSSGLAVRALVAWLVGLLIGAHALVKLPTSAVLGVAVFVAVLLVVRPTRHRLVALLALLIGAVVVPGWFFSTVETPAAWYADLKAVQSVSSHHGLVAMVWMPMRAVLGALARVAIAAGPASVMVWLAARFRSVGEHVKAVALEGVAVATAVLYIFVSRSWHTGALELERFWAPHFLCVWLAVIAWAYGEQSQPKEASRRRLVLAAVLFALPFVAAMGTSNLIVVQVLFHLAPWHALFACCVLAVAQTRSILPVALSLVLGVVSVAQVYAGQVSAPYGVKGTLAEQTEPLPSRLPAASSLRVSAVTARYVLETRRLLEGAGFQPGDPVWGLNDVAGLVYLVEGRALGTPWLFRAADLEGFNCFMIEHSPRTGAREFLILSREPSPLVRGCLARSGRPLEAAVRLGVVDGGPEGPLSILELLPR